MNGQSLVKALVPLPGSSTAVYTNAGFSYYSNSDWLGSNRLTSGPSRAALSTIAYGPFGEAYDSCCGAAMLGDFSVYPEPRRVQPDSAQPVPPSTTFQPLRLQIRPSYPP
jgi:hypothetical protein